MQVVAIPEILKGSDVILAAETGSGKTLAYLLPIIESLKSRTLKMQSTRPDAPSCVPVLLPPLPAALPSCAHCCTASLFPRPISKVV
jgi:superfamily II DNA/RNA helicase